jgi:diguanylate cyclase (GGDEF)-like protein
MRERINIVHGDLRLAHRQTERLEQEVTRLKQEVARLSVDAVTGLAGRGVFDAAFEREFRYSIRKRQTMALLMIDLDNFKRVNDTYGHPRGDAVLQAVARVISANTRTSDVCCRWGGDEFALVLPETTSSGAEIIARKILEGVKSLKFFPDCAVTVSMGWTIRFSGDDRASEILGRADKALLQAKQAGRNRIVGVLEERYYETF